MPEFNPHHHKRQGRGKFVRFELDDPKKLTLVVINPGNEVRRGVVDDPAEIALFVSKVAKTADGRYLGIFEPEHGATVPGGQEVIRNDNGEPKRDKDGNALTRRIPDKLVVLPAVVAPQAAILDANGGSNIAWLLGGDVVHRLLLPLDSLKNVEVIDLVANRDDVPEYRRKTMSENFKPA